MDPENMKEQTEDVIRWFFSNEDQAIHLKAGDVLLSQHEANHRIYYVKEGRLLGYLPDEEIAEPVLEAKAGEFVGVYSFFSYEHMSYSKVVSEGNAKVLYFEGDPFDITGEKGRAFQQFLFRMVVGEIRSRQQFAGQMAREHQKSLKKLIRSEKMALLGQMAAGLAHELNNAVGALTSNLDRIRTRIEFYFQKADAELFQLFEHGLEHGPHVGTKEVREGRAAYERLEEVDRLMARQLAKTGLDVEEVRRLIKKKIDLRDGINHWETGALLHDMHIAADHASHVVNSVKQLGVANQSWAKDVDVPQTIEQSLIVLTGLVKQVEVELNCEGDLPKIQASHGELMQVWINLIKNAIESLLMNKIPDPRITIICREIKDALVIAIEDNGPGIPKELQERVFEPSFTTKVGGLSFGLGLGLTIVQRIIEEHRGKVHLNSQPGKTCFEIELPIVESTLEGVVII